MPEWKYCLEYNCWRAGNWEWEHLLGVQLIGGILLRAVLNRGIVNRRTLIRGTLIRGVRIKGRRGGWVGVGAMRRVMAIVVYVPMNATAADKSPTKNAQAK